MSESATWGSDATAERSEEYFEVITEAVTVLINTFQNIRDDIYKRNRPPEEERFS